MDRFCEYDSETTQQLDEQTLFLIWKVLYYAYGPSQFDPPPPVTFGFRGQQLLQAIKEPAFAYAQHRYWNIRIDPLARRSTLSSDLACLMAALASPGRIFSRACQDIASNMAVCLMQYEGCEFRSQRLTRKFFDTIREVTFSDFPVPSDVDGSFQELIDQCWRYTKTVRLTMFQEVEVWSELSRGSDLRTTVEELVPRK